MVTGLLGPAAEKSIPAVRHAFRINNDQRLFSVGNKTFYETGMFTDAGYFDITRVAFIKSSAQGCLRAPHSIVITLSTAKKLFGDVDPMGKSMRMNNKTNYSVTGRSRFPQQLYTGI